MYDKFPIIMLIFANATLLPVNDDTTSDRSVSPSSELRLECSASPAVATAHESGCNFLLLTVNFDVCDTVVLLLHIILTVFVLSVLALRFRFPSVCDAYGSAVCLF